MDVIPRWSTLRMIGRSKVAQATTFIPIVGYLFVFNSEITAYLKLLPIFAKPASDKAIEDVNLTRLICLYVGLFCIGLGSIIFAIFSPTEIAENIDEHEFSVKELDMMTPSRFDAVRRRVLALEGLASEEMPAEIQRLQGLQLSDTLGASGMRSRELSGSGLAWSDWINRNKGDLSSAVSLHYQLLDRSMFELRCSISFLYVCGFGFLLLPSGQVFVKALTLLKTLAPSLFHL